MKIHSSSLLWKGVGRGNVLSLEEEVCGLGVSEMRAARPVFFKRRHIPRLRLPSVIFVLVRVIY